MDRSGTFTLGRARFLLYYWGLILAFSVLHGSDFVLWNACLVLVALGAIASHISSESRSVPTPVIFHWAAILLPVFIALQLLPLPLSLIKLLSAERFGMLSDLRLFGGTPSFAPFSAVPAQTWDQLLRICAYALTFFAIRPPILRLVKTGDWTPAYFLVFAAMVQCALGLLQVTYGIDDGVAKGSYFNRNHFAGLMEMAIPFAVAFSMAKMAGPGDHHSGSIHNAFVATNGLIAAALMLVAVLFSASKSGATSSLAGIFIVIAGARLSRLSRRKRIIAGILLGLALLGVLLLMPDRRVLVDVGDVIASGTETDLEGRIPIWRDALRLWTASPLLGSGAGTFPTVFTRFQTTSLDTFVVHAHNDYLEFLTDLGLIGAAPFLIILATAYHGTWKAALRHPSRNMRHLAAGCAGSMTAILIHSATDFNMFHRGNAMYLTWITAIAMALAASLPIPGPSSEPDNWFARQWRWQRPHWRHVRLPVLAGSLLLLLYAPAWIWLEAFHPHDTQMEKTLCQFGICDTDAMLTSLTTPEKGYSAAPIPDLEESVRRDPASHVRWHYLCMALELAGRSRESATCIANVVKRAPELAGENTLLARYYADRQQHDKALEILSRVLGRTSLYDNIIFATYKEHQYPIDRILASMPPGERAPGAYLRSLMQEQNVPAAQAVWAWLFPRRYANEPLAIEYTRFLVRQEQPHAAAEAWAGFLSSQDTVYRRTNFVYNGGFETPSRNSPFDWQFSDIAAATIEYDKTVVQEGTHSIRIHFNGYQNVNFQHVQQIIPVPPGVYRLDGYMRTDGITSVEGVGFAISGSSQEVSTPTLSGTNGWTKLQTQITVAHDTVLNIKVVRRAVQWKFDAKIAGTVWVDNLSLTRLP